MLRILEDGATAMPPMAPPSTCDPSYTLSLPAGQYTTTHLPSSAPASTTVSSTGSVNLAVSTSGSVASTVGGAESAPSSATDSSSLVQLSAATLGTNSVSPQHVVAATVNPVATQNTKAPAVVQPIDVMLARSSLANELRAVYHGLTGRNAVQTLYIIFPLFVRM